jgi:iron complex outermembrane receptor protein
MKRENNTHIIFIVFLMLSTLPVYAQVANTVKGTVEDVETKEPIAGANVLVLGTSLKAVTDDHGHYSIYNLRDGTYDIKASHVAYTAEVKRDISLDAGKTEIVDFQLARSVIEIPEIIVRTERIEQTSRSATGTVNVLSADEIARVNASTFDQALESVPGVMPSRSAGTATNSMSIRGSSDMRGGGVGNRVLLLIDGRPAITADTGGANWSLLPLDVIERVEVVKGALSPLYGSNAMGGVVNFITRSPTDFRSTKLNMGWGYFDRPPELMQYSDQRSYFGDIGLVHSNSYRDLGYIFSLSGKRSDGYRQNTDFSLYNAYGKLQYTNQRDLKLALSLSRTSLERGYPHIWLLDSTPPYLHPLKIAYEKTNDRQEKQVWDFDLFLSSPIGSNLKLSANLYRFENYSRSLFNPDDLEGDDRPYNFFTDSDADKSGGILQIDISHLRRNYLILGLDIQVDAVDSTPPELMFGKHRAETLAGFAQDRITVSDALTVMLGARYDFRHLEESKDEGQLSPKLGLSYQLSDDTAFRFSLGQAFRAPSLAEIYIRQSLHSGITFKENPDLKAEKLRLYAEIGVRRRLFDLLETDTSLFIYEFSDMIFWEPLDQSEYQVINLNRSVVKGAETGVNLYWRGLSAAANYTYLDAKDRTEGRADDKLPYKPRHSAYAALSYQYARFTLGLSIRYVSEMEEVIFYPNDAPDWFYVANSRLSYNLSDQVMLSVAVNNLLDREYEEMARYRMPGRSIAFRCSVGK